MRRGTRAIAQVYLWGKILEFGQGYRAQFCYPKTILAQDAGQTEHLCTLYGCEEERSCSWDSLFESFELNHFESLYPPMGVGALSPARLPEVTILKAEDLVFLGPRPEHKPEPQPA
jgi:hypothetical protein